MSETEDLERAREAVRAAVLADVSRTRGTRRRRVIAIVTGTALLLTAGAAIGAKELARPDQGLVPRIAACLDPQGIGAGFPLWDDSETPQQVCARLGLPSWDGSLQIGTGQP